VTRTRLEEEEEVAAAPVALEGDDMLDRNEALEVLEALTA